MCTFIREATNADRDWVVSVLKTHWGSTRFVSRGRLHQAERLPAFIATRDGESVGLLTYNVQDDELEVVTVNAFVERRGIGKRLLKAARTAAAAANCRRLWLVTTNDNTPAISFYKHLGFSLIAIHKGAVHIARHLNPDIPETGIGGVPICDELEFEISVHPAAG